jgi:hypothetical protein
VPQPISCSVDFAGVGVGLLDGVAWALLVADPLGVGFLVVADAEGDVLVDGELCVGVGEDRRWLVGLADAVGTEVCDAVSRLVPRKLPLTALAGTDAVAGDTTWLAGWLGDVVFPVLVAAGDPPVESSTAMMAATPHAARPMPPIRRVRYREREPSVRSSSGF